MSIRNGLLSLLVDGPKYGFQLKKEFEEATGSFWPLNVGQVYTTLSRLVRDEMVTEEGGGDDTQKSYRLTERGRDDVRAWFSTPRPADTLERDELTIKVALAIATGQPHVIDLLQAQRTEATGVLQSLTRRKARLEPADLSQAIVLDAAVARLDGELRWLDLCEARLRQTNTHNSTSGGRTQ